MGHGHGNMGVEIGGCLVWKNISLFGWGVGLDI